jgi:hypothetical protein
MKGTLHEGHFPRRVLYMKTDIHFFIISRSFPLTMFHTKAVVSNQNTHFVFNNFSFENPAVHEIMWENIVERSRPQVTIWRMSFGCSITKATDTHSEFIIRIALPLQQWFHKRVSLLRNTYVHFLFVIYCIVIKFRQIRIFCMKFARDI